MAGKRQEYKRRRKQRKAGISARARGIVSFSATGVVLCIILICCGNILKQNREEYYLSGQTDSQCLAEVTIPDDIPEIKLFYTGFTVSFNPAQHQPNYCVWELTAEKANGTEKRISNFRPDNDVLGCATLDDYRNSGFDRGHMVPAGDMKWDKQAMLDSHYLTNICPQSHALNGGRWSSLENKCREWVARDSVLIIACGPILSDRMPRSIGESGIPVPERFFKVVLAPYSIPPRAIGFIMPNDAPEEGLEAMAVSVDQIEEITGFDFFSCLPDDIENEVEATANFRQWNSRTKKR